VLRLEICTTTPDPYLLSLSLWTYHLLFFFFCSVLGFEFRCSSLLGRGSMTWVTLQALFCFSYFSGKVSLFHRTSLKQQSSYLWCPIWLGPLLCTSTPRLLVEKGSW
jgi:hypothetical protein